MPPKTPTPADAGAPATTTPPAPAAPVVDEAAAKAEARRKDHAAAVQTLSTHFGAVRWGKLLERAQRAGMSADDISALAAKMIATRKAHHPRNERAALLGAGTGFLCGLGLSPTAEDVKAFESALAATAV